MKTTLLSLLITLLPIAVYPQMSLAQGDDLFSLITEIESYIDSNSVGPTMKQFNRWRAYWEPRLYPHGDFDVAADAMIQWAESYTSQQSMMSSTSYEPNWTELGPFGISSTTETFTGIGRVIDLEMAESDPDILFAGTWGGGLWKTTDGGMNWHQLGTDNGLPILKIAAIKINQANHNQIWVATGCKYDYDFGSVGVYRTLNGGTTWEAVNSGLPQFSVQLGQAANCSKLLMHPTNPDRMFLVTTEGLYLTTNATGACTWSLVYNPSQEKLFNIEYHPTNSGTMFLSGRNIYRSTNGGTTWSTLKDGQNNDVTQFLQGNDVIRRIQIANSIDNPNILYALLVIEPLGSDNNPSQNQAHFVKFENGSWVNIGIRDNGLTGNTVGINRDHTRMAFAVNPSDADHVLLGQAVFFEFKNSGWVARGYHGTGHADNHDFIFHPDSPNVVIVANDGGVFRITWNGTAWEKESRFNGLAISTQYHLSSDKQNSYDITAGNHDNGTHMFDSNSTSWSIRGDGDGMRSTTKTHGSITNLVTSANSTGIMHDQSTASPPTNFPLNTGTTDIHSLIIGLISPDSDPFNWEPPIVQDPSNSDITYIGGGHLYKVDMQQTGTPTVAFPENRTV